MVDLIIEPAIKLDGLDLYDRGGNIALTNVMFALLGNGSHDTVLGLIQKMIRKLDPVDFEEFVYELFTQQFDMSMIAADQTTQTRQRLATDDAARKDFAKNVRELVAAAAEAK